MMTTAAEPNPDTKIAGLVLIATSLLSILLMAHHPTATSHETAAIASEIAAKASLSRFVHGALIAMLAAQVFAFADFCRRIGFDAAKVRAGMVAYALGAAALIGAALISGFLVSSLSETYAALPAGELDTYRHLLRFGMSGNQVLAKFGVVAISVAIVLWSIAAFRARIGHGWLPVVGLVTGLAPALALSFGLLKLDVTGMTIAVVCETIWNVAAGAWLLRARA